MQPVHSASRLSAHQYPDGIRGAAVALWDVLFTFLVAFPLLTGGFWIRQDSLRFELTQPGPGWALLLILGLGLCGGSGIRPERSVWLAFFTDVWTSWRGAIRLRPARTLWAWSVLVGMVWAFASLRRHWNFETGAYDLGIFTNTLWNFVSGNGYVSSIKGGINLFADHQSPVLFGFAPFFALVPRPETLLVVQALALASGAPALYRIARQYQAEGHWAAALLPVLYWFYLPLRNANAFDFHPETVMLPLFLWAIALLQEGRTGSRWRGALLMLAALGAKESAGAVAAGVGLAWLLGGGPEAVRGFTRKAGIVTIAAGVFVFWFDLKVVPGWVEGGQYAYTGAYGKLGDSVGEVVLSPFRKPLVFLDQVFGPARLKFLFLTLSPLAFLPLFGGTVLAAALPGYLILFMTSGDLRLGPGFHYAIEPAVGLFWAAVPGALKTEGWVRRFGGAWSPAVLTVWIAFWSVGMTGRTEWYRIRVHEPDSHRRWLASEFLPCVNREVPLAATGTLVPHLSDRHWIMDLPHLAGVDSGCVIRDSDLNEWPMGAEEISRLPARLRSRGFKPEYSCGSLKVWSSSGDCLKCRPHC